MKLILTLLIFVLGFLYTNQAFSQDKSLAKKEAVADTKEKGKDYAQKLNLSEEQSQKFEAIHKEYKESVSALKIKSKSKKSVKKLKALEEKRDHEIEVILTDEQFEQFLKIRREERNSLKTLIRKSNKQ